MKDFLTVKEVSKQIKKSPSTVRNLIRARKIKATKLAGKYGIYLINKSDMLEYLMNKMSERIANTKK